MESREYNKGVKEGTSGELGTAGMFECMQKIKAGAGGGQLHTRGEIIRGIEGGNEKRTGFSEIKSR